MGLRIPGARLCMLHHAVHHQPDQIGSWPYLAWYALQGRAYPGNRITVYSRVLFHLPIRVRSAACARLDLSGKVNAAGKKRNIFVRLVDRFKSYLPIIIAVLIRAYKMSQSVGWAMESRGLNLNRNGVKRTYRVNLTMRIADWIILVIHHRRHRRQRMVDDMAVIGGAMTQDEGRTTITARDLKVVSRCNATDA